MSKASQIRFGAEASSLKRQVVVMVHGVNVDEPGATVQEFASAYAITQGTPMETVDEVIWVPESDNADLRTVRTFPSHIRRLKAHDSDVLIAEVFWGDISHVTPTIWGTLAGLFQIIFSLRFAAKYAARPEGKTTPLQRICGFVGELIHGPILAINLFLAIATIGALMTTTLVLSAPKSKSKEKIHATHSIEQQKEPVEHKLKLKEPPHPAGPWTNPTMLAVSLLVVATCLVRTLRDTKSKQDWKMVDWSMIVIGSFVGAIAAYELLLYDVAGEVPRTFQFYGRVIVNVMNLLWGLIAILLFVAFLVMCYNVVFGKRQSRFGYVAAFIITSSIAGLWGLVIPVIWITLLNQIPHAYRIRGSEELLLRALALLGYLWITAAIAALLGAVTWIQLQSWAARNTAVGCPPKSRNQAPRLILGWALTAFMVLSTVLWSIAAVREGIAATRDLITTGVYRTPDEAVAELAEFTIPSASRLAITLVGVLGIGISVYVTHLRLVLDILLDVVNHFREEWWEEQSSKPGQKPKLRYTRRIRDRIEARMRAVLKAIDQESCQDAHLAVLAHSQGTVVAADVLAEAETAELLKPFKHRTLMTFGSPLTHLYNYYFPGEFPPIDFQNPRWAQLDQNIGQWVNVYRIDDFVGTIVADPGLSKPQNISVDKGGHTGYWSDRQVLAHIDQYLRE